MWLSTYSAWQQNLQFSALPQMLDGEFYENVQNRCTEKHMFYFSMKYHKVTINGKQFQCLHDGLSEEKCYPH